ncbi:MAG: hypothetical protein DME18_17360 [Verrucomicrobia bacterium]|nr:MAG: hypothetical protein DME18_17360 [Verrucomicrobiota bacterium]
MRTTNLSDDCAIVCAKVFIESLRFAGELDADYTLLATSKNARVETTKDADRNGSKPATHGQGERSAYHPQSARQSLGVGLLKMLLNEAGISRDEWLRAR